MADKTVGQSVAKGSMILLAAMLMVKLIGALFKVPLVRLLGDEGMGYFNAAYQIYSGLFVIATAGMPVALSKMVAESLAKNNLLETKKIFNAALSVFICIGVIGTFVLYFGAESFAKTISFPGAALCVKVMAPAIFFVSLMSVFRGFFQGTSNMYPTAISEVTEALCKLLIGYALAYTLFDKGLIIAASGAVGGVTIGTGIGFLVLLIIFLIKRKKIYSNIDYTTASRPYKKIFESLLLIAIPITISASVFTLTSLIDTFIVGQRLAEYLDEQTRTALYGMYTGKAVTMYSMPPTLITSICLSLVPAIAGAYAKKNIKAVQEATLTSIKIVILIILPATVGLITLADPILSLVFGSNNAVLLLRLLAPATLFVSMILVTNSILQATGKVFIPLINIGIAAVVKIIINYILVGNQSININGAPLGTSVCYFIYMALNIYMLNRFLKIKPNVWDFVIKPVFSALVMGFAAYTIYGFVSRYTGTGSEFHIAIPLVLAIGGGALIYGLLLLLTNCIKKDEILALPKGELILKLLQKLHLLRS